MTTTDILLTVLIIVNLAGAYQNRSILKLLRRVRIVALLTLLDSRAHAQPMGEEITAALTDARTLPPEIAKYMRYFTFSNSTVQKPEEVAEADAMLTFWLWSIAHEASPPKLRYVSPTVVAIRLDEFGIDFFTFGRLFFRDPYFHAPLTGDGKKETDRAAGFWLGKPEDVAELIKLTTSQTPLLRWDWFLVETSIQEGRGKPGEGTGIYDFYGITKRDDFFKVVGADLKKADELKRRWRAIVKESGVAYFPRQAERFDVVGGGAWFTLDVLDAPLGKRNALRQLDKDFAHQAEEHYAPGPAGLPWYLACAADGTLQNSAPDRVGPDKTRTGNRTTIDVGASCVRCHKEILRPIDNWAADSFRHPTTAEIPYEKAIETRRIYFNNIRAKLDQDRRAYVERLKECNGLTAEKNATLFAKWLDRYTEDRLSIADCARELGTTVERLQPVLIAVKAAGKLDPVLADLIAKPNPGKVRRDQWEEVFPIAQIYLGGGNATLPEKPTKPEPGGKKP